MSDKRYDVLTPSQSPR